MNYLLVVAILAICCGGYVMYNQDQNKIAALEQQLNDATTRSNAAPAAVTADEPAPAPTPLLSPSGMPNTVKLTNTASRPAGPLPRVTVVGPDGSHSSAIDAAAAAATAASNSAGVGTFTTLDGKTYSNCKVLKVEQDGVTFSHDDGITKILYPLLPPNIQKMFDYDPQKATAQTDAQIRYDRQQAASSNAAPAAINP